MTRLTDSVGKKRQPVRDFELRGHAIADVEEGAGLTVRGQGHADGEVGGEDLEPGASAADQLILVDETDSPIGQMSKADCHAGAGVLHRAFSLFILNGQDQLLLQRRSAQKDLWPNYWSNSCCSHPRVGESMNAAIHRRLHEELGLRCALRFLFKFRYQAQYNATSAEHELCSVFCGRSTEPVSANRDEIADWRWMDLAALEEELAGGGEHYTPWFKLEWARIRRDHLEEMLTPGGMRAWAYR